MRRVPLDLASVRVIEDVYAELPKIVCKKLCHEACGPIFMSRIEWQRILNKLGREPVGDAETLSCPMLTPKKECRVYDLRPLICRAYGLTEKLRCPFGCEPDHWITDAEFSAFAARIIAVAGNHE